MDIDIDKIHAWQEIERLKAEIKDLRERLAIPGIHMKRLMDVEYAEIERLKALITELAEWCSQNPESITERGKVLLQRAREAAK